MFSLEKLKGTKTSHKTGIFLFCLIFFANFSWAQDKGFRLTYNAKRLGDSCFQLTDNGNFKNGAVWSQNRIDLNQDFRIYAKLYFGNNTSSGADGIGWVIQYLGSNLGSAGEGIGFGGISPSLGIEFDSYTNPYDPYYDHISLIKNGDSKHIASPANTLVGPHIPLKSVNETVKDGKYYLVSIVWKASTKKLTCTFNGVQKINHTIDLQKDIFKDSQFVYWGFTAATGGSTNYHNVCIDSFFVTYENSCKIAFKNQIKPYYLCTPKTDTLEFKFVKIPNVYSKIEWSTGDTTSKIVQKISQTNNSFWVKLTNKYGVCKDSVKIAFIDPKLYIDSQFNFECTTQNKKFTVPGIWSSVIWNDNSNNFTKTLNSPGKYWVEATDKWKCKARDTFDYIVRPDTLKILSSAYKNPSCFGLQDGMAEITQVNRPTSAVIQYYWTTDGSKNRKISNLKSGTYKCIVSDLKGCTDSIAIPLVDPKSIKLSLKNKRDILCFGAKNGEIEVSATFGISPYQYSLNTGMGQLSTLFQNLDGGNYQVMVKDSMNCTDSLQVSISEPDSLSLQINGFQGDCFGDSKGKIEVLATGGTKPYNWNPAPTTTTATTLNGKFAEKIELLNLPSKLYLIMLTDANGCKKTVSQFISPKENIFISFDTSIKFNVAEKTKLKVNITPPGKYSYLWSPEKIFGSQIHDSTPIIKLYDKAFIQLTVTNENFCKKSLSFEIPVVIPPLYFWFPTAFSPDENALNDGYAPVGNFDWADFQIYTRWGEKIFQSTREIQHWDGNYLGKPCPEGVYIITARLKYERFEQKRDGRTSFTLLR